MNEWMDRQTTDRPMDERTDRWTDQMKDRPTEEHKMDGQSDS